MVNYNNSKIYKIEAINGKPEDIYIGSTTQFLCKRMAHHREEKSCCKSKLLFEKYGVENCRIILIENVNVETKEELLQKEALYIKSMKCVNKNIPNRTRTESVNAYNHKNKEKINEKTSERYYNNHEQNKIKSREKQQRCKLSNPPMSIICGCGGSHTQYSKSTHLKSVKHQKFINNII